MTDIDTRARATGVRRVHLVCGYLTPTGWINSDIRPGVGVDLVCDILEGLPLDDASIDYIVGHHVLPELGIYDQVPALRELRRVLKPAGVLRLSLPDLDRAIADYQRGDRHHFLIWDWDTVAGNLITHHKIGPPPQGGWDTWFFVREETFALGTSPTCRTATGA